LLFFLVLILFSPFCAQVYFLTQKPKNAIELDPQLWTIFSEHYTKEFIDLTNLLNQGYHIRSEAPSWLSFPTFLCASRADL
jgi:hypothetical protein